MSRKKKVYCHNCVFYIPGASGIAAEFQGVKREKCLHPNAIATKTIPESHVHPPITKQYFINPEEKNKRNNCKDYTFGINKKRLKSEKKETWWKFWKS